MSNKVSFIFEAIDRFSSIGRRINRVVGSSVNKMKQLASSMKSAGRATIALGKKMKDLGGKVKSVGKELSVKLSAAATGFIALAIRGFDKEATAIAKVRNTIRSTSRAAQLDLKQLTEEASRLQAKTLFGDETILNNATAQLLTFTNVAGSEFLRAQQAALDLSTLLDGDLKSASIQLGKALNAPVQNLSALSRSGIQFSKQQTEVIKSLAETGRLAQAQRIILTELERQYGGTAEAAARAGAGPLKQFANELGDTGEQIGKIALEFLKPLTALLRKFNKRLQESSPVTKKIITILILLAAVIGPIVLVVGQLVTMFGVLSVAAGILGVSITAISLPILAIVAVVGLLIAAGVLLFTRWDDIVGGLKLLIGDITNFVVDKFTKLIELVSSFGKKIFSFIQKIKELPLSIFKAGFDFASSFDFSKSSSANIDVNLKAPQNTVQSIKSSSNGNEFDIGVNMVTAP